MFLDHPVQDGVFGTPPLVVDAPSILRALIPGFAGRHGSLCLAFHPQGAKQGHLRPASLALGYSPLALAFPRARAEPPDPSSLNSSPSLKAVGIEPQAIVAAYHIAPRRLASGAQPAECLRVVTEAYVIPGEEAGEHRGG